MGIFYTLHSLTPDLKDAGQRNSRIFLIGMFLYVLTYVILKNLVFCKKLDEKIYETLFVGILIMFCADVFTMGFVYKNYFGRSITNEANEIWGDGDKKFDYDDTNHKYTQKTNKINYVEQIIDENKTPIKIPIVVSKIENFEEISKKSNNSKHSRHSKHNK